MDNDIRQRIVQIREHFALSQEEFGRVIGFKQSNVSRIESGVMEPTEITINAIIARFPVNPEWIKTGQGEMLISPEEYIAKGMELLGVQKIGEGFVKLLNDPKYAELQSVVAIEEMVKDKLDPDLAAYLQYILNKWRQGDENIRGWLKIQMDSISKGKEEVIKS